MCVLFVKYGISKYNQLLVCKISKGIPECLIIILSCTGIVKGLTNYFSKTRTKTIV
nr:MAG TPA: hypothetical protein [Caudoviricetes sp.]